MFFQTYVLAGPEYGEKFRTPLIILSSASAEFFADIMLCPFEATKVRIQTDLGYARGLSDGFSKILRNEGWGGLYAGIVPLWGRQVYSENTKKKYIQWKILYTVKKWKFIYSEKIYTE